MKKAIALLLCIFSMLSLFGCGEKAAPTATEPGPEPTVKKDYSAFAGIVADPKTWYDEFMALPIANDQMTEDELRQLCVEAFKANLSFVWTPNKAITYLYELTGDNYTVNLEPGIAYSGLAYATGSSSGTLYKVLKYYDRETGVVDVEAMDDAAIMSIMTSACARGAQQAWNRVSNSNSLGIMPTWNQFDSNILLVGTYNYAQEDYNYNFNRGKATDKIIEKNGKDVMYESYAMMKPADGLYSSSAWHVMMCGAEPVVVRNSTGKIDPSQSYVLILEQETIGTLSTKRNYQQENGVTLRPLGTVNEKFTFKKLLEQAYIPFTLKEFVGEDPVEPGEAYLGDRMKKKVAPASMKEAFSLMLCANYVICTVDVVVRAPDGQVLVSYDPGYRTTPGTYSVSLQVALDAERLAPYANGKNTIHVYAQLANGEYKEAYSGLLQLD